MPHLFSMDRVKLFDLVDFPNIFHLIMIFLQSVDPYFSARHVWFCHSPSSLILALGPGMISLVNNLIVSSLGWFIFANVMIDFRFVRCLIDEIKVNDKVDFFFHCFCSGLFDSSYDSYSTFRYSPYTKCYCCLTLLHNKVPSLENVFLSIFHPKTAVQPSFLNLTNDSNPFGCYKAPVVPSIHISLMLSRAHAVSA